MGKVVDILKKIGAVITDDHFVYTSGKHGSVYINKDALYPHTAETSEVCRLMAEMFKDKEIEAVVGPALGGIILSQWVAHHLSQMKGKEVLGVYTEKDATENQILRRGYDQVIKGKKILVVEDLTTTGGSVKKVVDTVRQAGGEVVSVCVMVNRDPINVNESTVGAPFVATDILEAKAFDEAECPLCKANKPININIGHGKAYLEEKAKK
ncbi:phosphoribosyltransferase [Patescibacteria group bacterium]|nr:phosphoribosyltransferase [Patescibacteria group bacterium]MBU1499461.1 phosphoribosyltransferase [Patescibacteria group bacterium]